MAVIDDHRCSTPFTVDLYRFVRERAMVAQRPREHGAEKLFGRFGERVARFCLKGKKTPTYHDLVDERLKMPRIRDALALASIPAPSTLC